MALLFRWTRRGLTLIGLVLLACVVAVLAFEGSEHPKRLVQAQLDRLFENEPGMSASFDSLSIDWFKPAVRIHGLHLAGSDEAPGEVTLDNTYIVLDLSRGLARARLAALQVNGGRVVISQAFAEAAGRVVGQAQEMLAGTAAEQAVDEHPTDAPSEAEEAPLPLCSLDQIAFTLIVPGGEKIALGTGSAKLTSNQDEAGALALAGTIVPPESTAPLRFRSRIDQQGVLLVDATIRNWRLRSRGNNMRSLLPPALQQVDLDLLASMDFTTRIVTEGSTPLTSKVRLVIKQGYLRPGPGLPALDDLNVNGELHWSSKQIPETMEDIWRAAEASGTFTAKIVGEAIDGTVRLPKGGVLEASLAAADMTLDERRLDELGLPEDGIVRNNWRAFDFKGRADVALGLRFDLTREADPLGGLDLCLSASSDGRSAFRYYGFAMPEYDREGIPLACDQVAGQAILGLRGGALRPATLALVNIRGSHGTGTFDANGTITSPVNQLPGTDGAAPTPDIDLVLHVNHRALDPELAEAMDGMRGTKWIWPTFNPSGGFVDATAKLRGRPELGGMTAEIDIHASDVEMRWVELPVGLHIDQFELGLRWSKTLGQDEDGWPWRAMGARFQGSGSSSSVSGLEFSGMLRDASTKGPFDVTGVRPMHAVRVHVPGLSLRGADWDDLATVIPELDEVAASLGTKGRMNLDWVDRSISPDAIREVSMEAVPAPVELLLRNFPMVTRNVRGRVLMSDEAWHANLIGDWTGGTQVAANLDESDHLAFFAAGIVPGNSALLGAIKSLDDGQEGSSSLSTEGLKLDGLVDATGSVSVAESAQDQAPHVDLFLRGNNFVFDALELKGLRGELTIRNGALVGESLDAALVGTPVHLTGTRFAFDPDSRQGSTFFETSINASDMPLDRAHMAAFFDSETLNGLFDELDWRATVDLDGVRLRLDGEDDGRVSVGIRGHVIAKNMHVVVGAPADLEHADIQLEDFVLEGGRARAWGRVAGLSATVAKRRMENGELLFSYVDQRLTVQGLESDFAGGKLRSLGGTAAALAVDLVSPYHFALGVELRDADAASLLEGAFGNDGNEAGNEGRVDAAVRFEGTPDDVLAANGAGWVRLSNARLWSIPVFRELFTQLGFDATGVFDSMRSNFAIQDGVIYLRGMNAHSPLLALVGSGTLDLNGSISSDLEVRYSLIDKLGPLAYFLYWLQNSILRVQIRGDLHRPVVLLRNSFFDVFKRGYRDRPRLPLPYPSPLPARF